MGPVAPPEAAKQPLVEIEGLILSSDAPPTLLVDQKSVRSARVKIEVEPATLEAAVEVLEGSGDIRSESNALQDRDRLPQIYLHSKSIPAR